MFGNILDLVASIYTVTLCRLHRIFSGLLADAENLPDLLNQYVYFFNNHRPAAALGYKSPVQYKTELGFV